MIGFVKLAVNLLSGLSGLLQRFDVPSSNDDFVRYGRHLGEEQWLPPLVHTPVGSYQGYFMKALGGRNFYAFEGIPYAETPERFQPSIPKIPVADAVFQANFAGPECMQTMAFHILKPTGTNIPPIIGSEDCLTCSIFTPSIRNGSKLPVMFHIHGGGFSWGKGSDYGPAYLLERDMVMVSCQYRLGILGFVTTGDAEYPGNLGLKDLKIALDWVQIVIPHFGGDPSKILLHGVSAAGVLAHLLAISPFAKSWGISALISGSGNAFAPWGIETRERSVDLVQKLATLIMCPTQSGSKAMVSCLSRRGPRPIIFAQMLLMGSELRPTEYFGPTIEPPGPTAIVTRSPFETYTKYRHEITPIPALFHISERDVHLARVAFRVFSTRRILTPQIFINFFPEFLHYSRGRSAVERNQITDKILNFYGGREKVMRSWDLAYTIFDDFLFSFPSWLSVQMHGGPGSPSYAMIYTFKSKNYGAAHRFGVYDDDIVVGHGEEEMLLFNRTDFQYLRRNLSDPDYRVLRGWQSIILNLASEGALKLPLSYQDERVILNMDPYVVGGFKKGDFDVLHFGENIAVTGSSTERRVAQFWWDLGIYKLQQ